MPTQPLPLTPKRKPKLRRIGTALRHNALGRAIRKARGKAKLTQLALAHRIGLKGEDAGAYICRVESGHMQPRLDTLTRISKALRISVSKLL